MKHVRQHINSLIREINTKLGMLNYSIEDVTEFEDGVSIWITYNLNDNIEKDIEINFIDNIIRFYRNPQDSYVLGEVEFRNTIEIPMLIFDFIDAENMKSM